MKARVLRIMDLPGVSSASGMAWFDDRFWVVGDDARWLFAFQTFGEMPERMIELFPDLPEENDRIPKMLKADLEAAAVFGQSLLLFGSGSLDTRRDVGVAIKLSPEISVSRFSLTSLYARFRALLSPEPFNLEGACAQGDDLLLFHRAHAQSRNGVFRLKGTQLFDGATASFEHSFIDLPLYRGLRIGISGVDYLPEQNSILFCAAVEDSPNIVADGEVLGSFIGFLDPAGWRSEFAPLEENGGMFKGKVEALCALESGLIYAVTDDDNGSSRLLEIELF